MWAASFLIVGDRVLDGTAIHGIRFTNRTPELPNAILVQVRGRDWYNKPKYFTQLEWQRILVDFATRTGEMNLNQSLCPKLSDSEKQRISNLLISKHSKAWNHAQSSPVVRRLVS